MSTTVRLADQNNQLMAYRILDDKMKIVRNKVVCESGLLMSNLADRYYPTNISVQDTNGNVSHVGGSALSYKYDGRHNRPILGGYCGLGYRLLMHHIILRRDGMTHTWVVCDKYSPNLWKSSRERISYEYTEDYQGKFYLKVCCFWFKDGSFTSLDEIAEAFNNL